MATWLDELKTNATVRISAWNERTARWRVIEGEVTPDQARAILAILEAKDE